ncbi:MAG: cadherin domain-containing protein, partial [Campylobacterota bacterium]|nr:cadherin domain-containing protein [Campylobacterota bacterium]
MTNIVKYLQGGGSHLSNLCANRLTLAPFLNLPKILMLLLFGLTLSLDASVKKVTGSFITVAEAGTTYVGDSSEQTYYINSSTEAGAMIRIIDKTGNNTIKLASGLRITSSKVVHNELVLTLSNGAIVNIRGADNFSYIANGRRSFSSFVTSTLGLSSVPDEGESVANGGSAYIPYPYSSPAPSPTDASTTLTAPTLSSKTNTTINLTLGTFTDADGTQNVTVKLYDNPALTNLVATDAAGSFTVLSASTSYYAVTTGEAKNGASGAWEVKSSSALITATDANDSTPDAFSFIDQTDVALSTPIESNTITVAGINIASALSVTTGEYQINGGAWSSANATVNNGDILKVRHTSSASVATDTNTSLTIGGVSDTFTLTTVANTAPTITSSATVDSAENQTAVITVTATDAQNDTRTYTLTGGADQAFFEINTTSGVLTFENAPDFETPADSDAGNDYVVEVTATDDGAGTLSDSQTITISVTDEVEAGLTELYIKSAVYDNNRTGTTADDKLYIYFNKTIDENSIAVDTGS